MNDNIFSDYFSGEWGRLAPLLETQACEAAEAGDVVRLNRIFSYHGAIGLAIGDEFLVSTLFRQFRDEYSDAQEDPRIKASQARFLALYHSFYADEGEALKYFAAARCCYPETDWYADEAAALLESIYWHYMFHTGTDEIYGIIGRLELLNSRLGGRLDTDLQLLGRISRNKSAAGDLYAIAGDISIDLSKTSILGQIPFLFINAAAAIGRGDHDGAGGVLNTLKAKAALFRHPWYSSRIAALQEGLASAPVMGQVSKRASIELFGGCRIKYQGLTLDMDKLNVRTGRELLLYLVTRRNLQDHKEALSELLFPGEPADRAFNRLYVSIHRLNSSLRGYFGEDFDSSFIYIRQGIVSVNTEAIDEVDTHIYRKMLSSAGHLYPHDREAAVELMLRGAERYVDDIAPGFYYLDWLEEYRSELKGMQAGALFKAFRHYREKGAAGPCRDIFTRLAGLDPLNEEYYSEYISLMLKDGRNVEALNLYRQYEDRLKKELGLSPSSGLKRLLAGKAG